LGVSIDFVIAFKHQGSTAKKSSLQKLQQGEWTLCWNDTS